MRCKSCLNIFSQPSQETKETQMCSICRGIKTGLKKKEICEKTAKIMQNRDTKEKIYVKLHRQIVLKDHHFIERYDVDAHLVIN